MTEKTEQEIKERIRDIDKRLMTMEWDKEHNQLNAGMETVYNELKEEQSKLAEKISPKPSSDA
ncbi:hypothetical protein HYX10_02730 [Candidatus Woesearchaeota archaeon]|nr:hypothetical protein [Candidatus Woesearchaeota archaeon]